MLNLILTVMAIALQAASLYCLMQYAPSWAKAAPEQSRVIAGSLSSFERAFYRYGVAHNGVMPEPTASIDGGLSQFQTPGRYLSFLPKAPVGFMWKYGQLGRHYVCLQSVDPGQPMDAALFHGVKRLRRFLPDGQLVISDGSRTCGSMSDVTSAAGALPRPLSVTFFMRYSAAGIPSTSALPCRGNACLSATAF
jgi:hypothetical protein